MAEQVGEHIIVAIVFTAIFCFWCFWMGLGLMIYLACYRRCCGQHSSDDVSETQAMFM
jgi:hypothetical protein